MSQHFRLSSASRSMSLKSVYQNGEEKAYEVFCLMRWPETNGKPVCPRCDCTESYNISTRRRFKCVACHHQFSVTSGTIFASRKMSFTDLLAAILIVMNSAKGVSMVQLSRDIDCQYKTAFVLSHKLREAIASEVADTRLSDEVEIDGAYFGGHIRPANYKEDRVDRRLAKNQTGKRRVVIAMRQRKGRTLALVAHGEHEGVEIANRIALPGTTIFADEASHWDILGASFKTARINHSEAYSYLDGTHTNNVESYFSRLRRMIAGQHHHVSAAHLHAYASQAAWLEDPRQESNGDLVYRSLGLAMAHPVSRSWAGYWQKTN